MSKSFNEDANPIQEFRNSITMKGKSDYQQILGSIKTKQKEISDKVFCYINSFDFMFL